MGIDNLVRDFIAQHKLPDSFLSSATLHFVPLAESIAKQAQSLSKPLLVGIHGCQGSGKSTLTDFLVFLFSQYHQVDSIGMSIDDFYLTKGARQELGDTVHPLLATRGVPGTHDIPLMTQTLDALLNQHEDVLIPRFNKAIDDRYPKEKWQTVRRVPKIIMFEGWCVGCKPEPDQSLTVAVNNLEQDEDSNGLWRSFVNKALANNYQEIFDKIDRFVMLRAPSFAAVEGWREQQEACLRETVREQNLDGSNVMNASEIKRFISHYQRTTEYALKILGEKADDLFELDERRIIRNSVIDKEFLG